MARQWVHGTEAAGAFPLALCAFLCLLSANQELEPLCFPEQSLSCVSSMAESSQSPRRLGGAEASLRWTPDSLDSCSTMVVTCLLCHSSGPPLPAYST